MLASSVELALFAESQFSRSVAVRADGAASDFISEAGGAGEARFSRLD
jgi:hypothetical protein